MGNCKIVYNDEVLIDLSQDSVTPETLDAGVTAHDKDGNPIVGTRTPEEPVTEELNVTANGTYEPEDGVDGFHKIVVDVPSEEPVLQAKSATPKAIEQLVEPDEGYDGLSSVRVDPIPDGYVYPTGTAYFYGNGTYDVSRYKNAYVNVSPRLGATSITKNGAHYARNYGFEGFASVIVNVAREPTVSIQAESTLIGNLWYLNNDGMATALGAGQTVAALGGAVFQIGDTTLREVSGLLSSIVVDQSRVYIFGENGYIA